MFPCNECAKLLIQAGIKEVIYFEVCLRLQYPLQGVSVLSTVGHLYAQAALLPLGTMSSVAAASRARLRPASAAEFTKSSLTGLLLQVAFSLHVVCE